LTAYFKKNPSQKRAGGVAQGVEHMPSKHKALTADPTAAKKKEKKRHIKKVKLFFNHLKI
jgi:hypothetical protein